jgi:hypothetical protein
MARRLNLALLSNLLPPGRPPMPYIAPHDATKGWTAGSSLQSPPDTVIFKVTSWPDKEIIIAGHSREFGDPRWTYTPGDEITVKVWNANSGRGPATSTMSYGSAP